MRRASAGLKETEILRVAGRVRHGQATGAFRARQAPAKLGKHPGADTGADCLKPCVEFAIHRDAAVFIAGYAGGPALGELIFALNNFVLRVGYIESKRH